jgi:hypothetical protein
VRKDVSYASVTSSSAGKASTSKSTSRDEPSPENFSRLEGQSLPRASAVPQTAVSAVEQTPIVEQEEHVKQADVEQTKVEQDVEQAHVEQEVEQAHIEQAHVEQTKVEQTETTKHPEAATVGASDDTKPKQSYTSQQALVTEEEIQNPPPVTEPLPPVARSATSILNPAAPEFVPSGYVYAPPSAGHALTHSHASALRGPPGVTRPPGATHPPGSTHGHSPFAAGLPPPRGHPTSGVHHPGTHQYSQQQAPVAQQQVSTPQQQAPLAQQQGVVAQPESNGTVESWRRRHESSLDFADDESFGITSPKFD